MTMDVPLTCGGSVKCGDLDQETGSGKQNAMSISSTDNKMSHFIKRLKFVNLSCNSGWRMDTRVDWKRYAAKTTYLRERWYADIQTCTHEMRYLLI